MPAAQATPTALTRTTSGVREGALLGTGVLALAAGATLFLAGRFQAILLVLVVIAFGFGLRRAMRVARVWKTGGRSIADETTAMVNPAWRSAAVVSAVMIGSELTLIGAAVLLQTTTNENWFKLYVLGLIAVPTSALIGPMLLVQQRWTSGHPHLRAEAAILCRGHSAARRAVIASRALAVVSWILALLLALAVLGLLVISLQTL